MSIIWTYGYTATKPETLVRILHATGAMLFDIRYSPLSRNSAWSGVAVSELVGQGNYCHVKALGNRNYRGGPIDIVDPDSALPFLREVLASRDIVLLCACAASERRSCHRWIVAYWLARLTGCEVRHITTWPHKPEVESILACHSRGDRRFSALYAPLVSMGNQTIESIYQSRKRDEQQMPIASPKGVRPAWIKADGQLYDAEAHAHAFYLMLWAIYFSELPALLWHARQFNAFQDVFDDRQGSLYRMSDSYPNNGGVCQSAAIAALCGGYVLPEPWATMLRKAIHYESKRSG